MALSRQLDSAQDWSLKNLKKEYPIDLTYKTRQKTNAGRVIPFEAIVPGLYRANAHCSCFITNESRMHPWISAVADILYKESCSNDTLSIMWQDTMGENAVQSTEFIVYEHLDSIDTEDDFLYKVIFFLTTGKIMVQGKAYNKWCRELFSTCLDTVNELCRVKDTYTEINKSEETVVKGVVSPQHTPSSKSKSRGKNSEIDKSEVTLLKSVVSPKVTPSRKSNILGKKNNREECILISPAIGSKSRSESEDSVFMNGTIENGDVNLKVSGHTNKIDHSKRMDISEDRLIDISDKFTKRCDDLNLKVSEHSSKVDKRMDIFEDRLIDISDKLTKLFNSKDKQMDNIASKLNSMEERQLKDKKELVEKINVFNSGSETAQREKYDLKLKELTTSHKTEMEKKMTSHGNETSMLKNKIKSLEKENQGLNFRCEKLEMSLEFEKKKSVSAANQYEERLKDKNEMIQVLQDRLSNMAYDFNGELWNKKKPVAKGSSQKIIGPTAQQNLIQNGCRSDDSSAILICEDEQGDKDSQDSVTGIESPLVEESPRVRNVSDDLSEGAMSTAGRNNETIYQAVLLHDSVCKDIDLKRLINVDQNKSKKIFTATVTEAHSWVQENVSHSNTIMLHVGINDLKSKGVDEVSKDLENLTKLCVQKADKVILSLPLVCKEPVLASKVAGLVSLLFHKLDKMEKLIIIRNDNFSNQGRIKDSLFKDNIHPNFEGTKLLASNMRFALNMFQSSKNERSGGRQRPQRETQSHALPVPSRGYYQNSRSYGNFGRGPQQQNFWGQGRMVSDLASALLQVMNRN